MSALYAKKVRALLSKDQRHIFLRLNSPHKIQTFLYSISINFEDDIETNHSPASVLKFKKAHCFEGAVLAAAIMAYHSQKPLLMDFVTAYDDEDHTVALFKKNGLWGAISKTNHVVLRYRDAVYRTPRELAMSYFHEYFMWDGRKSLRAYCEPFDVSQYEPARWITSSESLDWLMVALSKSRYHPVASKRVLRHLRLASPIERQSLRLTEWKKKKV